jgi:hypothetical protein
MKKTLLILISAFSVTMPVKLIIHYDYYCDGFLAQNIKYNKELFDANTKELDLQDNETFSIDIKPKLLCVIHSFRFTLRSDADSNEEFHLSAYMLLNNFKNISELELDSNNWIIFENNNPHKTPIILSPAIIWVNTKLKQTQIWINTKQEEWRRAISIWIYPPQFEDSPHTRPPFIRPNRNFIRLKNSL